MTKDEALKLALEALEPLVRRAAPWGELDWLNGCKAITVIKETLAQPEQDMPKIGCVNHDCAQCKAQPVQKRPQNCGTGYCSCVECVMEPEQEPVAWITKTGSVWKTKADETDTPLYTTPPQRKPLTDEEIETLYNAAPAKRDGWKAFARAIEAKLKDKNS